jgi:hypothetical protein
MAINDARRTNFNTLLTAARNGDLALLECTDKQTGEPVYVLCAVQADPDGMYSMVPLAKQFMDNPYDEVDPPEV